jgi:hypothetical protein
MDQANAEQAAEREKLADRTRLAEERFTYMEKRALLEIDRERIMAANIQKKAEAERAAHAAIVERARLEQNGAQSKIEHMREQIGRLQSSVEALNNEQDRERADLLSTRKRLEAAVHQAAAEHARASHLHDVLARTRAKVSIRQRSTSQGRAKRRGLGD